MYGSKRRRVVVTNLVATIGGKKYKCVPNKMSCKGCAFENECFRVNSPLSCPEIGDAQLGINARIIYKEIKTKKGAK